MPSISFGASGGADAEIQVPEKLEGAPNYDYQFQLRVTATSEQDEVIALSDLRGDSYQLSQMAAENTDCRMIAFCGVHFMAEVADMMTKPNQTAILPDLAAGCSMADMANLTKVERCWRELSNALGEDPANLITPITYINSAASIKAFVGERGGTVCTSSNCAATLNWAFARGERKDPLGRNFTNKPMLASKATKLIVFQKKFEALAGQKTPGVLVGHANAIEGKPFLGHEDARLQVLLPDHPSFDMAVNIFTYDAGATLPFVETHIMEHGLLMLKGQGVYRLDADHYPVKAGDVIWMASYCPQWFVAMGKTPAS